MGNENIVKKEKFDEDYAKHTVLKLYSAALTCSIGEEQRNKAFGGHIQCDKMECFSTLGSLYYTWECLLLIALNL